MNEKWYNHGRLNAFFCGLSFAIFSDEFFNGNTALMWAALVVAVANGSSWLLMLQIKFKP